MNWRRRALSNTSGSGSVLVPPGTALRAASLRSTALRSAPGGTKTPGGTAAPFTFVFMSVSFSAPYTKCRAGRRLTDLGTEGGLGNRLYVSGVVYFHHPRIVNGLFVKTVLALKSDDIIASDIHLNDSPSATERSVS